jgi:hypothetical protein
MGKRKFKFTNRQWYPVNYAGNNTIQDSPEYGAKDLLRQDECLGANYNAELAAKSPDMINKLMDLEILLSKLNNLESHPFKSEISSELEDIQSIKKDLNIS